MKLEREIELEKVTIGNPVEINSSIYLSNYDNSWSEIFEKEKEIIYSTLDEVTVEHVGSTSVVGLCAKPIVDIILLVNDSADENTYVPELEKRGYYLRIREPDWYEHRLMQKEGAQINLHIFSKGCKEAQRMVDFRDILRNDEKALQKYAAEKKLLAKRKWKYVQEYADAKSKVVNEILKMNNK